MSTIPQTLWLKGVYLRDLVTMDNIFEKTIEDELEKTNDTQSSSSSESYSNTESIVYDKIPKVFRNMNNWPKTINIRCSYCTLFIRKIPVPVPSAYEETRDCDQVFDVDTVCCSFPCALSLITESFNNSRLRWSRLGMIKLVRKIFYNELCRPETLNQQFGIESKDKIKPIKILNKEIPPAPKRNDLRQYGGEMSEKEFRHIVYNIDIDITKLCVNSFKK